MSRNLQPLSVRVRRERGEPPAVELLILSADLKSQPVHATYMDPMRALKLAEELLHAARIALGEAE